MIDMSSDTMPPAASVVMPVRDAAATLSEAVESVIGQSLASFELIAVDDGSSDETPEILARFAETDRRVRWIRQPPLGIVPALNKGLDLSRSAFIARMDADDVCAPLRLERQCDHLARHPQTGVVSCRVEYGGDRRHQAGYAAYVDWINTLTTHDAISRNRFVESPLAHPSAMFRRTCLERAGGYQDGPFPEDYELWLRWLEAGIRMEKVPETLLMWRDPPDRLSRSHERYAIKAFYECKARYLARWLSRHNPHHPHVIAWGAGRVTRKRAEHLVKHGVTITAYIDIDPRSIGQRIHGRPVLPPTPLPPAEEAFIVSCVGSRGARDDIRKRLTSEGHTEWKHFVMAA